MPELIPDAWRFKAVWREAKAGVANGTEQESTTQLCEYDTFNARITMAILIQSLHCTALFPAISN
jgi:hypothetical protein